MLATYIILSELLRKSMLTERELYESVKKIVEGMGGELPRNKFNKLLMTLELRGYLRVEGTKRIVQLVHRDSQQDG